MQQASGKSGLNFIFLKKLKMRLIDVHFKEVKEAQIVTEADKEIAEAEKELQVVAQNLSNATAEINKEIINQTNGETTSN